MDTETPRKARRTTTRVLIRTGLLALVFGMPGSFLDLLTTEIARQRGGFVELNPVGFQPLLDSILFEMRWMGIGAALLLFGAYQLRDVLAEAPNRSYDQLITELFSRKPWAVALIWLPCFCAILRYWIVLSNLCYLTLSWSPMDWVTLLPLEALFGNDAIAYVTLNVLLVLVLWIPVTELIFRSLYAIHRR